MTEKRCCTCHWWGYAGNFAAHRLCVLHTGLRHEPVRKVDFGGSKPLRTSAEFGCTEWQKDEREET